MRLIDADLFDNELVERAKKLFGEKFKTYEEIRAMLEAQPTVNPYEWISVEDRLPDLESALIKWGDRGYKQNSVRVLCTCRQKSGKVLVKEGYYEVWVDDKTSPYWKIPGSIDSVTYWMPLPEPPTEEEN